MGWTATAVNYEALPDGLYVGKVVEISELDTKFGPSLRFEFQLDDDDGSPSASRVSGMASLKAAMSPKAKLRLWSEALLGRKLRPDEEINDQTLLGKKAYITLTTVDVEGVKYNRIGTLSPWRPKKAAAAAPAPANAETTDTPLWDQMGEPPKSAPF
jgi:hypothetical protein